MKNDLWIIRADSDRCRSFVETIPITEQDFVRLVEAFRSGQTMGEQWKQVELQLFPGQPGEEVEERAKPIPDFTLGVVVDAISANARRILEQLIGDDVEFLPLSTEVGPYYDLNIKRVDCLDEKHSIVSRYESSGRIMDVQRYAFRWEQIQAHHIFCLPELGNMRIFVSGAFKAAVEQNRLIGFVFDAVPLVI